MQSDDVIQERLEERKRGREMQDELLRSDLEEEGLTEKIGGLHGRKSDMAEIAMYQLQLGNITEARSSFAEATANGVTMLYWIQVTHEQDGEPHSQWPVYIHESEQVLILSVLAGDRMLQQQATERMLAVHEEFEADQYALGRAGVLAGFLRDDDELVREFLDRLADSEPGGQQVKQRDALVAMYRGLLENDPAAVEEHVAWFAAHHERESEESWVGLSTYASYSILGIELARRRDMEVRVRGDSIPDALYDDWELFVGHDLPDLSQQLLEEIDEHELDTD